MCEIRDRSVVRSSVIPSAKYCCSGSLFRLAKGSTTIDRRGATAGSITDRAVWGFRSVIDAFAVIGLGFGGDGVGVDSRRKGEAFVFGCRWFAGAHCARHRGGGAGCSEGARKLRQDGVAGVFYAAAVGGVGV